MSINELENSINMHILHMNYQLYSFCDYKNIILKYDSIRCNNVLSKIIKENRFTNIGASLDHELNTLYNLEIKLSNLKKIK
jgi:hypothetical protein